MEQSCSVLDNHGIRYYDPEIGRYLTRDPIGYGDGMNVYLYVHGNPASHIDPLGLWMPPLPEMNDEQLRGFCQTMKVVAPVTIGLSVGLAALPLLAATSETWGPPAFVSLTAAAHNPQIQSMVGNGLFNAGLAAHDGDDPVKAAAVGVILGKATTPGGGGPKPLLPKRSGISGSPMPEPSRPIASEGGTGASVPQRLPQDVAVNPTAPAALPTDRPIGTSPTQNAAAQADVAKMQDEGYTDIRVNQQQVNAAGERVGLNRPDVQGTSPTGQRVYNEYDKTTSRRGPVHEKRIKANDPKSEVNPKKVN